jgi:SAM-dependent methyltransferase
MTDTDQNNVWVALNDDDHLAQVRLLDWAGAPGFYSYRHNLAGCDWVTQSIEPYLKPLAKKRGRNLRVVSFGSGNGTTDELLLQSDWPVESWTCCEFAEGLLPSILERLAPHCDNVKAIQFNFDKPAGLELGYFDVAFFGGAMHHCRNIETFLPYLNSVLADDGLVIGSDYFGPSRFQASYETKEVLNELWACLPSNLRKNLLSDEIEVDYHPQTWESVVAFDPSEAPRSSDLRDVFFSNFKPLEFRAQGGTLLRPMLSMRTGNYRDEKDVSILKLLMMIERTLIQSGKLRSDDVYFVCEKSKTIGVTPIENVGLLG